ncbi:MAG: dipeptidase [Gemmatimonadales bacterium]|jgi:dipeptidase D
MMARPRWAAGLLARSLPALALLHPVPAFGQTPSDRARDIAEYAAAVYLDDALSTLAGLVAFETVHRSGVPNERNPEFRAMTGFLLTKARQLGFDFTDYGSAVVIGLGESPDRVGLITHGDVQPAEAVRWADDPFGLDVDSEPGRLVGRGVEDDKGPIAAALYAMKALMDRGLPSNRRIELIISYTEESDWGPFVEFLQAHPPPPLNVVLDAEYPAVVAEKGWCLIRLTLPPDAGQPTGEPSLLTLEGGAFLSQIPAEARAVVSEPTPELARALQAAAHDYPAVDFAFIEQDGALEIVADGVAAHSSKPWDGRNAITHLAALLGTYEWPPSQASQMVRLINDLVGLGDYGEQFGQLAYSDPFMGPLTLSLTTLKAQDDGSLTASINLRRPAGRSGEAVERTIREAVKNWQRETGIDGLKLSLNINDPYYVKDAPHVPTLLGVFRYYTGRTKAEPISIGGGTHARLVPNGVNFGPAMPDEAYTGHSEHEYMTGDQFLLNLTMYTAMLAELTG